MYTLNTSPYGSHKKIVSLIKPNSSVLDVGCGMGFLKPLLEEKGCLAFGLDKVVTRESKYRDTWMIDIEKRPIPLDYDYIILGDVIEHIREPLKFLKSLKGRLIISVPNIANIYVRLKLLFGNFDYEDKGILDRTHTYFFTKKTLVKMIKDAGYRIVSLQTTPIPLHYLFPTPRILYWLLNKLTLPLFAYQYIAEVERKK